MSYNEARLRRSELVGEADTSAHPVAEPTTDDEGIDDFASVHVHSFILLIEHTHMFHKFEHVKHFLFFFRNFQ